jgi:hypothetical protein
VVPAEGWKIALASFQHFLGGREQGPQPRPKLALDGLEPLGDEPLVLAAALSSSRTRS